MNQPPVTKVAKLLAAVAERQLLDDNPAGALVIDPLAAKNKKNMARKAGKPVAEPPVLDSVAAEQSNSAEPPAESLGALDAALDTSTENNAENSDQPLQFAQHDSGSRSDVTAAHSEQLIFAIPESATPYVVAEPAGNASDSPSAAVSAEDAAGSSSDFLLPLLGVVAFGGGLALAGSGGGSSSSPALTTPAAPGVPAAPTLAVAATGATGYLTLSGTAEAGATVNIYDNGTLIATTVANSAGTYSTTNTSAPAMMIGEKAADLMLGREPLGASKVTAQ